MIIRNAKVPQVALIPAVLIVRRPTGEPELLSGINGIPAAAVIGLSLVLTSEISALLILLAVSAVGQAGLVVPARLPAAAAVRLAPESAMPTTASVVRAAAP